MSPAELESRAVEALRTRLAERLAAGLPGSAVQAAFQSELGYGRYFAAPPGDAVPAAVLVLIYLSRGVWHLPLTLRPEQLGQHAGQICLPGGLFEPGETGADAALRELEEELGVAGERVTMIGPLSPIYLYRSNFAVAPHLAIARSTLRWRPRDEEVAELIEVPLDHLIDPANVARQLRAAEGVGFSAPCFLWQRHAIWGATCLILAEIAAIWRDVTRP
jgi:8-oxo-dGTP pyrophosphatase MutT (NUDIX family)